MENKNLTGFPSIDKPWLKYYSDEALNATLPECTVYENIYQRNSMRPKSVALEYYGRKITFSEFFQKIDEVKRAFESFGVKKGDIVVMITSSTPETIYCVLALCRIGAVANMINPFFERQQMIDRISETGAEVLVVLDRLYKNIACFSDEIPVKKRIVVPITNSAPTITKVAARLKLGMVKIRYDENVLSWNDFIKSAKSKSSLPDAEYEKERPFIMVYSSGTTGASKGIVLTNGGINATVNHYLSMGFKYDSRSSMLQMIPVWFSTGIVFSIIMPLSLGIIVVLEPVFNEKVFVQDLIKYKPNMVLTATSLWVYACNNTKLKNTDLSHLSMPITGGEKITADTENFINDFLSKHNCNNKILKGYGMCELGSTVTADSQEVIKIGSVGFPIKGVSVSAFDYNTDKELKYNERGEIRVLSPARMKEYFKNPEATAAFFHTDKNGNMWGRTGDVGYVDEDGFVYILGRAADCFKSESGRTIYCFDIEHIILCHKDVNRCKVVGVEKNGKGIAIAHIVLEENADKNPETILTELDKLCSEQLDGESAPFGYILRDDMPIKNSGKLNVEELKRSTKEVTRITDNGVKIIKI